MSNAITHCTLVLKDGSEFHGKSFGADISGSGEVVFNTAMTGYPESLTDPSYKGQLLALTYPLVGNYGVPEHRFENGLSAFFESSSIHIAGLIISDYSFQYSHWNARKSLSQWLEEHNIPGIYGIDTRALTQHIREKGAMPGKIIKKGNDLDFIDPNLTNLAATVSTKEKKTYGNGKYKIMLIDCGVKYNIIRCLLQRDTTVIRVPWDYPFAQNPDEYDGLFISNGPGDPTHCTATIKQLELAFQMDKPIFGICLGNQLMALASGARTYKLKYGHRGHNQPVQQVNTPRVFITSQNHGYAIDHSTLPTDWQPLFTNLNDQTNEGLLHTQKPFFSAQFHPEAAGGPSDTAFLFDSFISCLRRVRGADNLLKTFLSSGIGIF
jgi:carbamoyl-phosphate synthase small subunit